MKNIKYNIKVIALVFAMLIVGISCDDGFDELSKNPNATTSATGKFVLAGAQVDLSYYTSYQLGINYIGLWVQHHASGAYPDEDQYSPRLNDINVFWNNLYDNSMRDFKHILTTTENSGDVNLHAVAMILSSYGYMMISDVWGDIPYSEALLGSEGMLTPVFDSQKDVYAGIIADLKTAVGMIDMAKSVDFGVEDVVFGGDMDKWMRFANSLRLRAFMHLSEVDPVVAKAGVVEMLGRPLISSQEENAGVRYSNTAGNRNPVHSRLEGRKNDFRISKSVTSRMIAEDAGGTKEVPQDPRLAVFAEVNADSVYQGIPNGITSLAAVGLTNASTSKIGKLYAAANATAYFMTYAEVEFIRAEAAQRMWISDDPAEAYNNAIKVSMEQNGIDDDGVITTFLEASNIVYAPDRAKEQIATQKWLALWGQSIEAWTNWRRTGFPNIPVAQNDQNNGVIPRRLMYGSIEAATNRTNVDAATARQGGAELSNRIYIDPM